MLVFAAVNAGGALVVARPVFAPDAIVSLASHEWERLPVAARAAFDHPHAIVLLTLPQPATAHNCHDCSRRVDRLGHYGVAAERVRVLPIVGNGTYGEALTTLAHARAAGLRRLLVITSPYHTRRSLATFESVFEGSGIEIGVEPAMGASAAVPERWWLAGYDRAYVAYEWAAVLYYLVKYGVPF